VLGSEIPTPAPTVLQDEKTHNDILSWFAAAPSSIRPPPPREPHLRAGLLRSPPPRQPPSSSTSPSSTSSSPIPRACPNLSAESSRMRWNPRRRRRPGPRGVAPGRAKLVRTDQLGARRRHPAAGSALVVRALQHAAAEPVLCMRLYVWESRFGQHFARDRSVRRALGDVPWRRGPVVLFSILAAALVPCCTHRIGGRPLLSPSRGPCLHAFLSRGLLLVSRFLTPTNQDALLLISGNQYHVLHLLCLSLVRCEYWLDFQIVITLEFIGDCTQVVEYCNLY
jgi:hypothetical protein